MPPEPTEDLIRQVREGLKRLASPGREASARLLRTLRPVLADLTRFVALSDEFKDRGRRHTAALFRDGTDGSQVPVLLAPDLIDFDESYDGLRDVMRRSDISLVEVDDGEAEDIFVHRVAEFLTAYGSGGGGPWRHTGITEVHTNRHGDPVLRCLGYFVSTATAFGTSTSVLTNLKGRYSFGIVDNGVHRYDGVVWSCPAIVTVRLP